MLILFLFFFPFLGLIKTALKGDSAIRAEGTSKPTTEVEQIVRKLGEDYTQKSDPRIQKELHAFHMYLVENLKLNILTKHVT